MRKSILTIPWDSGYNERNDNFYSVSSMAIILVIVVGKLSITSYIFTQDKSPKKQSTWETEEISARRRFIGKELSRCIVKLQNTYEITPPRTETSEPPC